MPSFRRLVENLSELATVPSRASAGACEKIATLIDEQFTDGTDPYGKRWAPLTRATLKRRPWRKPPPLTDTERMRGSVRVTPMRGSGIQITIDGDPSNFHQTGTVHMVARTILPDGPALPESWQEAIEDSVEEAFAKVRRTA